MYYDYALMIFISGCIVAGIGMAAYNVGYRRGTKETLLDIAKRMERGKKK